MSDSSSSSDEDDSVQQEVFNLEHFQLFLASGLIGGLDEEFTQSIQAAAANKSNLGKSIAIRLQWRSPLLLEGLDPATLRMEQLPVLPVDDSKVDLVFLDADFVLETKLKKNDDSSPPTTSHHSTLQFGVMTRLPVNSYASEGLYSYHKGEPVTTEFLEKHMDQHDDVLTETSSESNAHQMATALRNVPKGVQAVSHHKTRVPLIYEEDQTEPSYLSISSFCSPDVDLRLLGPLLANGFSKKAPPTPPSPIQKDDKKILLTQYGIWKQKAAQLLREAHAQPVASAVAAKPSSAEKKKAKKEKSQKKKDKKKKKKVQPNIKYGFNVYKESKGFVRNKKKKKEVVMAAAAGSSADEVSE